MFSCARQLSRIVCLDRNATSSARAVRILATATVLVSSLLITSQTAAGQSLAATCQAPPTGYHYAAIGDSNYGSNKGTGGYQSTWSSWSLNGHSDGFSNEAVWSRDWNNLSNSLEVGFSVGSSTIGYINYQHPYYTTANGANPKDYPTVLPTLTSIWNSATSDGVHSWAYVNGQLLAEITYGVATPRWNYEQTEVNYHDIWMGGGSGSGMVLRYQDSSNNWHNWGNKNGAWSPAGYGYYISTSQPDYADQGGYGACS